MTAGRNFAQTMLYHVRLGHLRRAGGEVLVASVVLLLAGMLLMGMNVSALRRIGAAMQHSHMTVRLIDQLDDGITGAELAARGYLLSGNVFFRDRYFVRLDQVRIAQGQLAAVQSDQPDAVAALNRFGAFIASRRNVLDPVLSAPVPAPGALNMDDIASPRVWQTRMDVERALYDIRDRELERVGAMQQQAQQRSRDVFMLALVFATTAVLLAGMGLFLAGIIGRVLNTPAGNV